MAVKDSPSNPGLPRPKRTRGAQPKIRQPQRWAEADDAELQDEPPSDEPRRDEAASNEAEAEDLPEEEAPRRRWFNRELVNSVLAFLASTVVHFAVLILFGMLMLPPKDQVFIAQLFSAPTPEEELTVELDPDIDPSLETETSAMSAVTEGMGMQAGEISMENQPVFDQKATEAVDVGEIQIEGPMLNAPPGDRLIANVPIGTKGDARAIVDNYDEAMDRITQEILLKLNTQKVLVIWVFDQSESMKDDQAEIRERISRVYTELGLTSRAQGDALLTAVTSYGQGFMVHTEKPTSDLDMIRRAMDDVPIDPSGKEMMCNAVGQSIAIHKKALVGNRKMMLILVTDETGERSDNDQYLEPMIQEARSANCNVYVLGREAVFGYPYAHFRWVHPDTGHVHWLPVDRGPETAFVEQLQTDGFRRRYDAHPSGYGPYEQSRMARETGGIFFMLPSLESNLVRGEKRRYELEAMRPYKPDLRSKAEIKADIDASILRTGLTKIIYDLNPYRDEIAKYIVMRHHFSPDIKSFAQQVGQEQTKAVMYLKYLDAATKFAEELQKIRDQEYSPRWQANLDLLHGQLYAYTVRLYEYGAGLEEFKRNPQIVPLTKPPDLRLVHWDIVTASRRLSGEKGDEYVKKANELFAKVIADHPGTPWAARADWEMKRGYGIELRPDYDRPRPPFKGVPRPVPKL